MPAIFPKYIPYLCGLLATVFVSAQGIGAQASESVTATVTAQEVSLTVDDGTIAYGILDVNAQKSTLDLTDTQTVTNTSNVNADFTISGTNSTDWNLAATPGTDEYVHEFTTSGTFPGTNLTTNLTTLDSAVAPNGTISLDLRITMPSSTTVYTQQSVDVSVQVTAS